MKKVIFIFFISCLFLTCQEKNSQKLTIATAANMQFAMEALSKSFTAETGIVCEIIIGSSGKLTAQIQQGAPFDVFVSADMKYPSELFKSGLTTDAPKIYAYGNLVLWTTTQHIQLTNFSSCIPLLISDTINHIALANPKTAPYGVAAIEVLKHYQILENIESKLVYGESIAQTNQFITTQAAELGFTAKSVVLSSKMKNNGQWISIDSGIYKPIAQGVVILKQSEKRLLQSQNFYNFLFSAKAKEILDNFGYNVD
jgi:molybdate transport system substrate-binding protein